MLIVLSMSHIGHILENNLINVLLHGFKSLEDYFESIMWILGFEHQWKSTKNSILPHIEHLGTNLESIPPSTFLIVLGKPKSFRHNKFMLLLALMPQVYMHYDFSETA
jgi:hypothetical protein